jgi:HEPN domain-containing protein
MSDGDEARVLLAAAAAEKVALERMLASPPFPPRTIGMLAQQCVEKSLKAWLCLLGVEYPHVHSIEHLLGELRAEGADVERWRSLRRLTPYAGRLQYADPAGDPPLDTSGAVADAQALHEHVSELLARLAGAADAPGSTTGS